MKSRRHVTVLAGLALVAALLPTTVAGALVPATLYVDINDGTCDNSTVDSSIDPYCDIEAAVSNAAPLGGDTIMVAAGTYTDHDSDTEVVFIDRNVTIIGNSATDTFIDGQDNDVGIWVSANSVTVQNVTVKRGSYATGGGVVIAGSSSLALTDAAVTTSSATTFGGGLFMSSGSTVTITRSTFAQNTAPSSGGAITVSASAESTTTTLTIVDSFFIENSAENGGAIYVAGNQTSATTTIDIDGTTFDGNDAENNGGAILHSHPLATLTIDTSRFIGNGTDYGGTPDDHTTNGGAIASTLNGPVTVTASEFSGNAAVNGGAIYSAISSFTVRNSTVSGNIATAKGGGLSEFRGTIENSTIALNDAPTGGGLEGSIVSPPTVRNTILADNTGTSGPNCTYMASDGYNLIDDTTGCTISGDTTGNVTGTDPQLVALANNGGPTQTHAFWPGAAPQNAGNPAAEGSGGSACLATDQRGETRSDFGACDIGAFELDTYVNRLSGPDRFSTAAAISTEFWPSGSDTVIIANGLNFPDALTGANLYGLDAPLLLVQSNSIPGATSAELSRLAPTTIYVLGGTAVVEASVATALNADWGSGTATVTRLSGADRYSTAVAITTEAFPSGVDTLLIANGLNFPDALAGGAAASKIGAALLITDPNTLPATIQAEITRLDPDTIWILGGTAAVSANVETVLATLAPTVDRIAGADRFSTAAAIAAEFFDTADKVLVATGLNYPDALAGALAAGGVSPVLLIQTSSVPASIQAEIESMGARTVFVLGGTAAIDATAFSALEVIVGL